MSSNEKTERFQSPRLLRRSFFVFILALVVFILTFLVIFAASLYKAGRINAVSRAAALEQYVGRSLEVSSVVARDALEYIDQRGSLEGLASDYDAHRYFSNLASGMSIAEGMIFVDGNGTVVLHSDSFPAQPVDLSDRAWFRAHVEGQERVIDGAFMSRVTETLIFVHTFAIRNSEGILQGAINIGIPSDQILGAQAFPLDGQGVITSVLKETGELIAREPFPHDLIGARFEISEQIQDGSVVLNRRPTDGRRALTAYATLKDFGLVASVSIPLAVVLRPLTITAAITLPLLAIIVFGAFTALRHLESQQRQLARSAIRLETVLQASGLGAWQWFPKSDRAEFLGRWADMLGYRQEELNPDISTWKRVLHPEEKDHLIESVDRLLSGKRHKFYEEHRMRHKDGHWVWVLERIRVVERDANGKPEIMIGIHLDISERREAEEQIRVVSLEVDHRSKNLLAVVQALISMTKLESEKTFKSILRGRIQAMARAHELLSRSRWKGADLRVVAEEELSPYINGQTAEVIIDGGRTVLGTSATQALAMTLHELATNAAKYGALSVPDGRLSLTWSIAEDEPTFTILWEETFPRASEKRPAASGFGTRLIHLMIEEQLGGQLETEWTDDVLRYRMNIPKSQLLSPSIDRQGPAQAHVPVNGNKPLRNEARILLVEDDVLLAAEMASTLEAAGYVVAGPATDLQTAISLAQDAEVDAAVLDVNLGGELSFPVADVLLARGVPFIFVTGYHHDRLIPGRFGHAPVVRKPSPPGALERAIADARSVHVLQDGEAAGVAEPD